MTGLPRAPEVGQNAPAARDSVMNGFIIVNGLMVVFSLVLLIGALWAVLRLRQMAPMMMRRRLDREIALRLDVMSAMSLDYADAGTATARAAGAQLPLQPRRCACARPECIDTAEMDAHFRSRRRAGTARAA